MKSYKGIQVYCKYLTSTTTNIQADTSIQQFTPKTTVSDKKIGKAANSMWSIKVLKSTSVNYSFQIQYTSSVLS